MFKIEINLTNIDSIPFDIYFSEIIGLPKQENMEFYGKCGKEHYRMLSYISSLFDNCDIIDIGTHKGMSALSLSYNETNTIYSFDIVNNVSETIIKEKPNIKYIYDNLWEVKNQEIWKEKIFNSKFIFLDVDPHNGVMEMVFYDFLKKINYTGFIICDDIWHFKPMRDVFWYKLNKDYCYDFTHLGHWSGTGIITFADNKYVFNKNNLSNWTLVTAYFNLTKCFDASEEIKARDKNYYLNSSISTLSLPYNLVIYCDKESYDQIKIIRPSYLFERTYFVICNFESFRFKKKNQYLKETFTDYREKIIKNRINNPYHFDNRNTPSYYLFCMSRYIMLKEVIEKNIFNSTHFSWINFCIERMGYSNVMKLEEALSVNRDKFSTCYIDYIPEELINDTPKYFEYGRCSMCSGFFTGNKFYMYKVCDLIENKFLEYLEQGYGHADEQLYSPVYFNNTQLFEHYYGDYQQMITNYKYIYENPNAPIINFIKNSFNFKYHEKSLEACNFLLNSIKLGKVNIENYYLSHLLWYRENLMLHLGIKE